MGIFIEDIYGITVHYTAVKGYKKSWVPLLLYLRIFLNTIDTAMICTV